MNAYDCVCPYITCLLCPNPATGYLPEFSHHSSDAAMGGLLFEEENPCSAQSSGMYRGITAHRVCMCVCECVRVYSFMCVCMLAENKKARNVLPAKTKLIPKCVSA